MTALRDSAVCGEAVRRIVRPGSVVLDLGGDGGRLAVIACRAGAARVVSVQPPVAWPAVRELTAANRCAERVQLVESLNAFRGDAAETSVDTVLASAPGRFPFYGRTIIDAVRVLPARPAAIMPRSERLMLAVISSSSAYAHHVEAWDDNAFGIALGPARRLALNAVSRFEEAPENLSRRRLASPACWATIDYSSPAVDTRTVRADVELVIEDAGLGHGLTIWSDVELADGLAFNFVGVFLPWLEPVTLSVGDRLSLSLRLDAIGSVDVWNWTTRVTFADQSCPPKQFRQSTFLSDMAPQTMLRRAESDHVPTLSDDGLIARRVLTMMGEGRTLDDMRERLATEFPQRFPESSDAERTLETLCSRYARPDVEHGQRG